MKRILISFCLLFSFMAACYWDKNGVQVAMTTDFNLLTYNISGLPQSFSAGNPAKNIPLISPLLNKYDIVLVQEDFYYHAALRTKANHRYKSIPKARPSEFLLSDGLNRFSIFPFENFKRIAWTTCSNDKDNDCYAVKGFTVARTQIAPGVEIDIYNIHLDAGSSAKDVAARRTQIEHLLSIMNTYSPNHAVIIAGDLNLHTENSHDDEILLQKLLDVGGLTDACESAACQTPLVDRVLFRGSDLIDLTVLSWQIDRSFVNSAGGGLSDHNAIGVEFRWRPK